MNMFSFMNKDKGKVIHVNDLDKLIGKIELIDIRETYEYKSGSIQTAKNIPMGNLISEPNKYMQKDKTYYLMCQSGGRSNMASKALIKQGYDVINVAGGMGAYVGTKRQ